MRSAEERNFTSVYNRSSMKIGPDSALTPDQREEEELERAGEL